MSDGVDRDLVIEWYELLKEAVSNYRHGYVQPEDKQLAADALAGAVEQVIGEIRENVTKTFTVIFTVPVLFTTELTYEGLATEDEVEEVFNREVKDAVLDASYDAGTGYGSVSGLPDEWSVSRGPECSDIDSYGGEVWVDED